MIGDAMYQVPGSRLSEMSNRITELTARAERAEAALGRVRELLVDGNGNPIHDTKRVSIGDLRTALDAQRPAEGGPEKLTEAEDPIERDRAQARTEIELVQRWWVRDEEGYTYRVVGPKAAAKVKAEGWGGVKREEFEVVYDFEFRPSSSRYFPAALDGGQPDTPAPTVDEFYAMHDHGPGTERHAHAVGQTHMGDVRNPRANDHTGVPITTWAEIQRTPAPTQVTGDQIVRQIALDAALRQQLHRSTPENPPAASELIEDANRIADWLRG